MLGRTFLSIGLLVLPASSVLADARITVSATVLKRATLDVSGQPDSLVLTEADIARGYVDAPPGLSIEVRSNSPQGVMVGFIAESELVSGVEGGPLRLTGAARGVSVQVLRPSYRFMLSPAARPGVYAWPVRVSVSPL
jgi:hypothetical protein